MQCYYVIHLVYCLFQKNKKERDSTESWLTISKLANFSHIISQGHDWENGVGGGVGEGNTEEQIFLNGVK